MRSNTCVLEQHDSECIDLILLVNATSFTKQQQQHNFNYQRLQHRITPPPPPSSPLLPKKEFNSIDLSILDKQLYLDNSNTTTNNNNTNNTNNNNNIKKDNNDCDDDDDSKSGKNSDDDTNDSDGSNHLKRFKKLNNIKKKLININSILVSNVSPINQ
ncbi:hypothetical protein ACTFIR_001336 [Dictyostelium discoideum]